MKRREFLQIAGATGALLIAAPSSLVTAKSRSTVPDAEDAFLNPPEEAAPWVVWHWTGCNATPEGVTASIEAMAEAGITAATLFSFPPGNGTVIDDPAEPLSEQWWDLVQHSMEEADRCGIDMAMQICATWATAGGPFITPELSQQQLVWREMTVEGGRPFTAAIERPDPPFEGEDDVPQSWREYYRDLAVLAVPAADDWDATSENRNVEVTTNLPCSSIEQLADGSNNEVVIESEEAGWIQFAFQEPFTLRAVTMDPGPINPFAGSLTYATAHGMEVQASDDGETFRRIGSLEPMWNSWQTRVFVLTHVVPETTARSFRLVYEPKSPIAYDEAMRSGSAQQANVEDLVAPLGVASVVLSSRPSVHHLPGKNAQVWGRSRRITSDDLPPNACVSLDAVEDLSDRLQEDDTIANWTPGEGPWRLLRIGYTTKGETNGSGPGTGLEADKFSAEAARVQFQSLYGEALDRIGPRLAGQVLSMLNIDSWECGSQNWSPVFREEFRARRGYDVLRYLPAMTGIPVESADVTERFLHDVRRTGSELIRDNFFGTLQELSHAHGSLVQTESVCPTMMSDGMEIYKNVDVSAGEFWVTAWRNWKPCDIKEAVSTAHVYGKRIAMAEAFTGGGDWGLHPFDMKALGDHNFAEGINRFMLHLWTAQPYPGRMPGVPGAAGAYFNEHNTWMPVPGNAYIEYLHRAQSVLQRGKPVADALYFTGEEVPSRALIPPKYGSFFVTDPPLPDGYAYDSINRDALLVHARVEDGDIVLDSGTRYRVLILRPEPLLTTEVVHKIKRLVESGATVYGPRPLGSPGNEGTAEADEEVRRVADEVWGGIDGEDVTENRFGRGRVVWGPPLDEMLAELDVSADVRFEGLVNASTGERVEVNAYEPTGTDPTLVGADRQGWGMEWHHRRDGDSDVYFLTNQEYFPVSVTVSFRQEGRVPELWHADTGRIEEASVWREEQGRIIVPLELPPSGSLFVVFRRSAREIDPVVAFSGPRPYPRLAVVPEGVEVWARAPGEWSLHTRAGRSLSAHAPAVPQPTTIEAPWTVSFPEGFGAPAEIRLNTLSSLSEHADDGVRHFSGTSTYATSFDVAYDQLGQDVRWRLDLGRVADIAQVRLNGRALGTAWKPPFVLDVSDLLAAGTNQLEVKVTNTWRNRLIGDAGLPEDERVTWLARSAGFGAPDYDADSPLAPSGLIGPVQLVPEVKARIAAR